MRTGLLLSLTGLLTAGAAIAQEGAPRVVTTRAQAGPEYALLGEYVGLRSGGYRREWVGVQVHSVADGLAAVEYDGGLPGAGWNLGDKARATGSRVDRLALIDGDALRLVVLKDKLWLHDGDGILRGLIKKVHRQSPTLGAAPPPGAIVVFNGHPSPELVDPVVTADGLLCEGTVTRRSFDDFLMHLEFRTPYMAAASGQARGNSGVYIQRRYEVQILDSFGLEGEANECGGLYRQRKPDVNACLPPLTWQTYDITFRAARFDNTGQKTANARITVRHNGILIHDDVEIVAKTGAGQAEGPEPRPILFQDHHDPVRFRNIWIVAGSAGSTSPLPAAGCLARDVISRDTAIRQYDSPAAVLLERPQAAAWTSGYRASIDSSRALTVGHSSSITLK